MGNADAIAAVDALLMAELVNPCPRCERKLTYSDVTYENGSTEYGTGFCMVTLYDPNCDVNVIEVNSWYPGIEDADGLLYVLRSDDWRIAPGYEPIS